MKNKEKKQMYYIDIMEQKRKKTILEIFKRDYLNPRILPHIALQVLKLRTTTSLANFCTSMKLYDKQRIIKQTILLTKFFSCSQQSLTKNKSELLNIYNYRRKDLESLMKQCQKQNKSKEILVKYAQLWERWFEKLLKNDCEGNISEINRNEKKNQDHKEKQRFVKKIKSSKVCLTKKSVQQKNCVGKQGFYNESKNQLSQISQIKEDCKINFVSEEQKSQQPYNNLHNRNNVIPQSQRQRNKIINFNLPHHLKNNPPKKLNIRKNKNTQQSINISQKSIFCSSQRQKPDNFKKERRSHLLLQQNKSLFSNQYLKHKKINQSQKIISYKEKQKLFSIKSKRQINIKKKHLHKIHQTSSKNKINNNLSEIYQENQRIFSCKQNKIRTVSFFPDEVNEQKESFLKDIDNYSASVKDFSEKSINVSLKKILINIKNTKVKNQSYNERNGSNNSQKQFRSQKLFKKTQKVLPFKKSESKKKLVNFSYESQKSDKRKKQRQQRKSYFKNGVKMKQKRNSKLILKNILGKRQKSLKRINASRKIIEQNDLQSQNEIEDKIATLHQKEYEKKRFLIRKQNSMNLYLHDYNNSNLQISKNQNYTVDLENKENFFDEFINFREGIPPTIFNHQKNTNYNYIQQYNCIYGEYNALPLQCQKQNIDKKQQHFKNKVFSYETQQLNQMKSLLSSLTSLTQKNI